MDPKQKESLPTVDYSESNDDILKEIQQGQDTTSIEKIPNAPKSPVVVADDNQTDDKSTQVGHHSSKVKIDEQTELSDLIADDNDLIEKEWVDKAKKVIADNKDDPRKQGHSINLVKKDYLHKRYGKELKIESED